MSKSINSQSIRNRIGCFRVSTDVVEEASGNEISRERFMAAMSQCIVVRCEQRYDTRSLHYTALSPCFDEIPECIMPPDYEWRFEFKTMKNKKTKVTAKAFRIQ